MRRLVATSQIYIPARSVTINRDPDDAKTAWVSQPRWTRLGTMVTGRSLSRACAAGGETSRSRGSSAGLSHLMITVFPQKQLQSKAVFMAASTLRHCAEPYGSFLMLSRGPNPWQDGPLSNRSSIVRSPRRDQRPSRPVRNAAAGIAVQHHLRRGDDAACLRAAAGGAFRARAGLGRPLPRLWRRAAARHGVELRDRRRVLVQPPTAIGAAALGRTLVGDAEPAVSAVDHSAASDQRPLWHLRHERRRRGALWSAPDGDRRPQRHPVAD